MKTSILVMAVVCASAAVGCGASSAQEQQKALVHQENSDNAADAGAYGTAEAEQRKAQDAHHDAVTKAIDEGRPIPPQTKPGDQPAPAQ
jgi:hypothetical protein